MRKTIFLLLLLNLSLLGMAQGPDKVVKHPYSTSIGGASTDTSSLVTVWSYSWAFNYTDNHIIEGQFKADSISVSPNYTFVVEKSFDFLTWVAMTTQTHVTGVDTVIYFADTTSWPYVRVRNTAISGAQVVKNKLFFSITN